MGFFSKVAKAVKKVTKPVTKVVGGVLKTAGSVASVIPGVGALAGAAAVTLGEVLSPTKQAAIVEAVSEQGVVRVDKIEDTIINENPAIDVSTLKAAAGVMTDVAIAANPTAKIDDSKAEVAKVDFMTKAIQWVKSNFLIVGAVIVGFFMFNSKKGGRRRRY